MFAIKAEVSDPTAKEFTFNDQKTMYGGKQIAKGDVIFIFARKRRWPRSSRYWHRNLGWCYSEKTWDRPADAARQHKN
jgi:hypothetical protein